MLNPVVHKVVTPGFKKLTKSMKSVPGTLKISQLIKTFAHFIKPESSLTLS